MENIGSNSNTTEINSLTDEQFLEWFRGLVDGEGSFSIVPNKNYFYFRFSIYMHNKPISILYFSGVHTVQIRVGKSISGLGERTNVQIVNPLVTHRTLNFKCLSFRGASCLRHYICSTSGSNGNLFHLHDRKKKYLHNNGPTHAVILQANQRNFSTYNSPILTPLLNPWFITGYADAESSFILLVNKNAKYATGYSIQPCFSISAHKKDRALLESVAFFGKGNITKSGKDAILYRVSSTKDIVQVIIPHFNQYPLLSKKYADYACFRQELELMRDKKHLSAEGFRYILGIKASLNLGLPSPLKTAFPDISPISKALVQLPKEINPYWVAGFASGEACFSVNIWKSLSNKLGERVSCKFRITQHSRDAELETFDYFFRLWVLL